MQLTVVPAAILHGRVRVPGDKSISHRAVLLGAVAEGPTTVRGFLRADDCLRTVASVRALGVRVTELNGATLRVHGNGGDLSAPGGALNAGNSGTTLRLLAGILATQPFLSELTGDASLRRRPVDRIVEPLRQMGATVEALREGRYPPLRIRGGRLRGITYTLPVASAQVKSAVLLAGLRALGETSVVEPAPTRDHMERLLRVFGATVRHADGRVTIVPGSLQGREVVVPGDFSSAAFLLTAAAARPGSEVTVEGVGVNPTRTGALDVLREMGAEVHVRTSVEESGEPAAAVTVRGARLGGVTIGGAVIPRVIDELPVLCVAAAVAEGRTEIRDAGELRVKESDRIAVMATGLRTLGATVEERPDGLMIEGGRLRGGVVDAAGDHRIAMAFAVAGVLADAPVIVRGADAVGISYPGFYETLDGLRESSPA